MSYSVSKKLELIRDINKEAYQLYSSLKDEARGTYDDLSIIALFIDIISRDSRDYVRFDKSEVITYFNENMNEKEVALFECYRLCSEKSLSYFLFV